MTKRTATIPNTPVARRQRIAEHLASGAVKSQGQLEALLAADGLDVTQATVSRDLEELGAVKTRNEEGALVYSVQDDGAGVIGGSENRKARVARLASEVIVGVDSSANLVILRTPPGAAQFMASALDTGGLTEVLGTIAGDDTVLVVTRSPEGGADFANYMKVLAEGTSRV